MSTCRAVSWVLGKGCLIWPVCSLDKTPLAFILASFCTPRPNLTVISVISWLPTVAFQSPMMKMASFFGLSSGRCCRASQSQLQLLWHQWLRHRLGLLWYWMVCLGKKPRSLCCFWGCPKYYILGVFVVYEDYSISSKGFWPMIVDVMIIWIKFAHSHWLRW